MFKVTFVCQYSTDLFSQKVINFYNYQHAHSRIAVRVSRRETVLHAQILPYLRANTYGKICARIIANTNARGIPTNIDNVV